MPGDMYCIIEKCLRIAFYVFKVKEMPLLLSAHRQDLLHQPLIKVQIIGFKQNVILAMQRSNERLIGISR